MRPYTRPKIHGVYWLAVQHSRHDHIPAQMTHHDEEWAIAPGIHYWAKYAHPVVSSQIDGILVRTIGRCTAVRRIERSQFLVTNSSFVEPTALPVL